MAFHLIAFYDSVLSSGTLQAITPVPDSTLTINGSLAYVPDKYNQVVGLLETTGGLASKPEARLQSPSLREMFYPAVTFFETISNALKYEQFNNFGDSPIQLVTNEGLEWYDNSGGNGSTAQAVYGLVWLADGKLAPSPGKIYTMRATTAISAAAGAWVNGPLTFDQTLPVGVYDVVGMRVEATGAVGARLNFIGSSAVTRPGVAVSYNASTPDIQKFRRGNGGVFGEFSSITPPSLDLLGGTSTSQVVYLDLIKKG